MLKSKVKAMRNNYGGNCYGLDHPISRAAM